MSNVLLDALKADAPGLASAFVAYIEANRPAIDAKLTPLADQGVTYLENVILSAIPANGAIATFFGSEIKTVISTFANNLITKTGVVDSLVSLAEMELTRLGAQLAAS